MRITAARQPRLMRAIEQDSLPRDLLIREHFGLSKVDKLDDELRLMGLYKGLLVLLDNPPSTKTLHRWQQSNKLAKGILKAYSGRESGYLSWFKKNKHLVDQNYANPKDPRAPPKRGETISDDFYKDVLSS